uniref:B30.2/SPRY domain-containing protein n=1 Tax=Oncorhynchus kisutch TaxID=8019 RepID=A0A8C7L6T5_ONCKI
MSNQLNLPQVPALGRPIHPGMLYDCCSESFTPDFLCDSDNKIKRKISLPFPFTETKVIETDSLQERFRALGLDQPIRTSFLSGLVDVGGAAEYLNHPLLHKGDYVTLHYKRTTRLDQLTFFLLEKVRCPEVIQQQTSTHMVMAVTYGTQAFIVCKTNRTWTMSKVINKLKKMIQLLTAEDGAAQLATSSGLTCTYYGDLETNRGDREITDLSESFPKLLGLSGEKAVPLRVWLCPLKNLYPAATCVREISEDLQSRVEREMEHYRYTGTRCEEMVKHEWVSKVQDLKDKLIRFIDLIQQYLAQLQKLMGRMLVSVRSEVQEEKAVEEEMKGHDLSPFRMEATGQWLDDKQAELKFLESLDSKIRSKMVSTDQLQKVISNSKTDTHLDSLQTYSQTRPGHRYQHTQPWFKSEENKNRVTTAARAFLDFVKVTKKLKFVATSIPNDSTPGASIRLYQGGRLVDSDYEAVSKPETVKVVDTEQTDVTLDPDTAHCELILSDNGRRMTVGKNRKVPNNPQRFDGWACILGKEGFRSGRHFWHVEVNIEVEASWAVGVTRSLLKGKDGSLSHQMNSTLCVFKTNLPWPSNLKVLDVCVDIEERWVSFYNAVSRSHVYTITDMVFTKGERIYPLFRTYGRDKGLMIQELK